MRNKSRIKDFFTLTLISIFCFGVLCLSGCGGTSCETIQCGSYDEEEGQAAGVSIPGCGGCITPGKGCDSCLWSQSIKISSVSMVDGSRVTNNLQENEEIKFIGCDGRYYDGGCLGCGQAEKSCYAGAYTKNSENWGLFAGSTDSEEKYLGCSNGCAGCFSIEDPVLGESLQTIEILEGID